MNENLEALQEPQFTIYKRIRPHFVRPSGCHIQLKIWEVLALCTVYYSVVYSYLQYSVIC